MNRAPPTTRTWTSETKDAPLAETVQLPRGTALGRYVILERLGAGGMGVVYLAYDPGLRREVALKLMASPGREGLLQEAQAMARLSHPHVAAVHDVGMFGDELFIAMEHLCGGSLKSWAAREQPAPKALLAAMRQAGSGLACAHAAGLVHGDFKPSNVLLGADGRPKVTDFGVASAAWLPGLHARSDTKPLRGTVAYLAPEQHAGEAATPASDQFAFCVSLYELLTGRLPFTGAGIEEVLDSKRRGLPPGERPRVPSWLFRCLQRGTAPTPGARFESMDRLLAELKTGPRRQVRRRAGTALVAALAFAGLFQQLGRQRQAEACARLANVEEVWNREKASQLLDTLSGAHKSAGLRLATQTVARLDAYAAELRARTEASCRAHALDGVLTRQEDARQRDCLAERREALRLYTVTFDGARPERMAHAHLAAAVLPRIDTCSNLKALARRPGPADEEGRRRAASLTADLLESRVLYTAGAAEESAEKARHALAKARALGDDWRTSEALYGLGSALLKRERLEEAKARLVDAALVARSVHADELALRAESLLVFLAGYRQAQVEQGRLWARMAQATLKRLGGHDEMEGQLHNDLGLLETISGQHALAVEHFRRSLALKEQTLGPDHPSSQWPRNNLALALSYLGRKREALLVLEDSLRRGREILGEGHVDTLRVQTNIAVVAAEAGLLGRSREALSQAFELGTQHLPPSDPMLAWMRAVRMKLALAAGRWTEAEQEARSALSLMREAYGPKAVPTAERTGDVARVLSAAGRHEEALAYWADALDILGPAVGADLFRSQFRVRRASTLVAAGRLAAAEQEVKALLMLEGSKALNPQLKMDLLELHAELLLRRGRVAAAREALEALLHSRREEDAFLHVPAQLLLARVHTEEGDAAAAERVLVRAREAVQQADATPTLADVTFALAQQRCEQGEGLAQEAAELYRQSFEQGRAGLKRVEAWRAAGRRSAPSCKRTPPAPRVGASSTGAEPGAL